jgi:hypothetical protein
MKKSQAGAHRWIEEQEKRMRQRARILLVGIAISKCSTSGPYRVHVARRPALGCGAVQRHHPAAQASFVGHSVAAAGHRSSGRHLVRAAGPDFVSQPL